jgi:N-acetylneuraminic acid mutarotase
MNSVRAFAAAAQLRDGKLLVTGGVGDSNSALNSAEMLTGERWESNISSLRVTVSGHCMVTVNSTTVMVIGGWQYGYSGKTFFFTFGQESWTEGPELKNKRTSHTCGKIKRNKESQEMSIIVAGGNDDSYLSSVEILDEGSKEWETGPELPFGIWRSQLVEDQNGGVVLIGGERSSNVVLDTLYQLPHGGKDAVWTKMEQKLKLGRRMHTAFLVPDNHVDCN